MPISSTGSGTFGGGNIQGSTGGIGTVTIDGGSYVYTSLTGTYFDGADGTVNFENGGSITLYSSALNQSVFVLAESSGSTGTGTFNIDGAGSSLVLTGTGGAVNGATFLSAANNSTGAINVTNGGYVSAMELSVVGYGGTGNGSLNVDGVGSLALISGDRGAFDDGAGIPSSFGSQLFAGRSPGSTAQINVTNGGRLTLESASAGAPVRDSTRAVIGEFDGSTGTVIVDGAGSTLEVIQRSQIGYSGATIDIGLGGQGNIAVRNNGTAQALGANARMTVANGLYDGITGAPIHTNLQSVLRIESGGTVLVDSQNYTGANITVGSHANTSGRIEVDGIGSSLTVRTDTDVGDPNDPNGATSDYFSGSLRIGRLGDGSLQISNGATVNVRELEVGLFSADLGAAGEAINTTSGYSAAPAFSGSGVVDVLNGSQLVATATDNTAYRGLDLAGASGTSAIVNIDGDGSKLISQGGAGRLRVARYGEATLNLTNGGDAYGFFVDIGRENGSNGVVNVTGIGSTLTVSDEFGAFVGYNGRDLGHAGFLRVGRNDGSYGKLTIASGGVVNVQNDPTGLYDLPAVQAGRNVGATGVIEIDGAGSQLNVVMTGPVGDQGNPNVAVGPELIIGDGGLGTATVSNDAQINIIGSDAKLNIADGRYVDGLPTASTTQSTLSVLSGADVIVDSRGYGAAYSTSGAGYNFGSTVVVGGFRDTNGRLIVDGAGSTFTVRSDTDIGAIGSNEGSDYTSGGFFIGDRGYGTLEISNGGAVFGREIEVGIRGGTIDGTGQTIESSRGYLVATDFAGNGVVNITTGGQLTLTTSDNAAYRGVDIGIGSGTSGQITIDGAGSLLTSQGGAGRVSAGRYGTGEITIQNGGELQGFFGDFARNNGGTGRLNISGTGSTATFSDEFGRFAGTGSGGEIGNYLGEAAFVRFGVDSGSYGKLTVSGGGVLNVQNDPTGNYDRPILRFGQKEGSIGVGDIYGAGSQVNIIQTGLIGGNSNPNTESGPEFQLGADFGDSGGGGTAAVIVRDQAQLNLSGDGAKAIIGHGLDGVAGDAATSTLTIQSGASVNIDALNGTVGAYFEIGRNETGNGVVVVDGAGSQLNIISDVLDANEGATYSGIVTIGSRGEGDLIVSNGGAFDLNANDDRGGSFDIGAYSTGVGRVIVDTGGTIQVQGTYDSVFVGTIDIGREGDGTLIIQGGGSVTNAAIDGASSVGREVGSTGLLTVDGVGSQFNGGSSLVVGSDFDFVARSALSANGGDGKVVLTNGGSVVATTATVGATGLIGGHGVFTGNLVLEGGSFGLDGTVAAAPALDDLIILGDLTADASSNIDLAVDGLGAGQFDAITVSGTATIDSSALKVGAPTAAAAPGTVATLISATTLVTTGDTLETVLTEQFGTVPLEGASGLNGRAQGNLVGNTGTDFVFAALGTDRANATAEVDFGATTLQGVTVETVNGFGVGTGGGYEDFNLYGVSAVQGTLGDDTISMLTTTGVLINARGGSNTVTSGKGEDSIFSGTGADTISAGEGDDLISSGDGVDVIIGGAGSDLVRSGLGADIIIFGNAGGGLTFGQDQLWGTVAELDGDTVTDFATNDAIGVLDASGNVIAASLNVGGGTIEIDVGSNGVVDATIFVSNSLSGGGTTLGGLNPFSGSTSTDTGGGSTGGPPTDLALQGNPDNNDIAGLDGNDVLSGFAGDDTLSGGAGNDTLNGGSGNDTLDGGLGNDRFFVDSVDDVVIEAAGEGRDTVTTSVDFTLPDNVEVGSMSGVGDVRLTGNGLANTLSGNSGNNDLLGLAGADRLRGGAGNDTLEGGEGNDILEGQDGVDRFVMSANNGDDQIIGWEASTDILDFEALGLRFADLRITSSGNEALITFDDPAGGTGSVRLIDIDPEVLEIGIMSDPGGVGSGLGAPGGIPLVAGTSASENLAGSAAGDDLIGLAGSDTLNGRAGDDTMLGGFGDDRYLLDDAGDIALELEFQGIDQVDTRFDLVLGANIERAAVRGGGAVDITGNELDNFITGSDLQNVLIGGDGRDRLIARAGNDTLDGGLDRDVLEGGAGEDVFVFGADSDVDLITDFVVGEDLIDVSALGIAFADMTIVDGALGALVIFDAAPGSVDLVTLQGVSAADVRLASFIGAPNLPIIGTAGDDVLRGTVEDDELQGLGGADRLDGLSGADTLIGGPGDDRYFVDDAVDVVIEFAGEGTDLVSSLVDFTLPEHVENGSALGTGNVDLTGNGLANALTGNDAGNVLTGLDGDDNLQGKAGADTIDGGAGFDVLRGGADADVFVFAPGDGATGDQIIDFEVGVDTIDLSATGLGFGDLTIVDVGANANVTYGMNTLTVFNTTAAELDQDQFGF